MKKKSKSTAIEEREKRARDFTKKYNRACKRKRLSVEALKELLPALVRLRDDWLQVPGVTGLDVGYKIKDGVAVPPDPGDPLRFKLRLHVREKATKSEDVPPGQLFFEGGDVIEATYGAQHFIGAMSAEAVNLKGRLDPLVGGASVGNEWHGNTGTLGLVVWDTTDGRPCILGNWHVLARGARIVSGAPIYQPGPYDGATIQDRVALLKRWLINERMDAALAELTGDRSYAAGAIWAQRPVGRISELNEIYLGQKVVKSGRSTRDTRGMVEGVLGAYLVDYGGGTRLLIDQIRIGPDPDLARPVSQAGDSGSVWLYESPGRTAAHALGLHFAGDSSGLGRFALATPMETVALDLRFSVIPDVLMCQQDLDALRFTAARARASEQPVQDPIGGGGAQPVGAPIGGGGAQPVGAPIGGSGAQPVGAPIGGGGAQPVGAPIGGGGAQPVGAPIGGAALDVVL